MIRAVLDANVYVSGLQFGGRAEEILDHLVADRFLCFSSRVIRKEVEETLCGKFEWTSDQITNLDSSLWSRTAMVEPTIRVKICRDPNDDHLLELSQEAGADLLVSGDKDLLVLERFGRTQIVSLTSFSKILAIPHA